MYLTVKQVTDRLNISRSTLYNLIRKGRFMSPTKIGCSTRFCENHLNAWLESKSAR
jgi:excisionase family DNA binding protein